MTSRAVLKKQHFIEKAKIAFGQLLDTKIMFLFIATSGHTEDYQLVW